MPVTRRLAQLHSHLWRGCFEGPAAAPLDQLMLCGGPVSPSPSSAAATGLSSAAAASANSARRWDMSDEELYMFDTMGCLRVRNMLDEETVARALESSRRIADGDPHGLLRGGGGAPHRGGSFYDNAFLHDKVIERIASSPRMLDYVCHVTNNQPRLSEQMLMVQRSTDTFNNFHLRKDNPQQILEDAPRFHTDYVSRRIYVDHCSFFVYLTDVHEGDGGLCVVPGGHRTGFKYPTGMFYPPGAEPRDSADRRKLGFVQVTARAGDCIIMPLRLCHAVLPWIPSERDRVVLFYNFIPQFYHSEKPPTTVTTLSGLDDAVATIDQSSGRLQVLANQGQHLDPATRELIATRSKGEMKEVVRRHLETEVTAEVRHNDAYN